jgi:Carbohydrate family 9 binding domain-like/Domain of unknown function (DUF5916)
MRTYSAPGGPTRHGQALLALAALFILVAFARGARAQAPVVPAPAPTSTPPASTPNTSQPQTSEQPAAAGVNASATANASGEGASTPGALPPEKAKPVRVPMFKAAPVIDGRLEDEAWSQAATLKDFYQIDPGDNIAPSQPTEVLMGYDAKNLYIAVRAHDQKGAVTASVARRDNIFDDDNVTIMLDTYNDARRAYVLGFNPLGVQADGIRTEGVGDDYSVDIVMTSKGVINDSGYTIEVAIPFKSLRYEAGEERLWGVHVFRRIKRLNNENSSWMPISRVNSGLLNQEGHITGLEGIDAGRTFELIPSLTVSENGRRVRPFSQADAAANPALRASGRLVNEPVTLDPGLTAKLGITPSITLDLAINPDFAQVEADVPVITANQRFPIFFAEKRPFFLEGIEIFQTPLTALHTRAIIDPDVAVKLTGKRGRNSFGLIVASDSGPGNFIGDERLSPSNFRFLDRNASEAVLRLKRNLGAENTLGFIATSYSFVERHNHLGGVDGRFRLNSQRTLTFQVLGTNSRRFFFDPQLGRNVYRTGNGLAYAFNLDDSGRHFGYTFSSFGRTNDYRADLGFTQRTDTNQDKLNLRYSSEPNPKGRLVSWRLTNISTVDYDWQGRSQDAKNETQLLLNVRWQGFVQMGYSRGYERLVEEEFGPARNATQGGAFAGDDPERSARQREIYAFAQVTPTRKYTIFFYAQHRANAFDFDFGAPPRFARVSPGALLDPDAPLNPGPGGLRHYEFTFIYQPSAPLRISYNLNRSTLTRNDTGRVAFQDNISVLRATYQFTRFSFARVRLDYSSLSSRMRAQLLWGWTPNPGTAIYVGYNDDATVSGFSPFTGEPLGGFRRNSRGFFIKMSYLFRRSM